jgi:type VII secretion-associated serine protease mycosin
LALILAFGLVLASSAPALADSVRQSQWPLRFLHVEEAQQITRGEGITVAVLDTGVDATQSDLTGNVLSGYDDWASARDGRSDGDGHGTSVAALIAGHGHGAGGGDGILGVAPKAKILPYTIYNPDDPRQIHTTAKLAAGIRWAVDRGVQVICIASAGGGGADLESAVQYALGKGVPVVAGADNRPDTDPGFPAIYSGVISVSSVDEQGNFATEISTTGDGIRFSAPGDNIIVPKRGGGYESAEGNSYATALTAGVVALIRAKYPTLNASQVFQRLQATVVDRGSKGWDRQYGYGTIDPIAALTRENVDPSPSVSASRSSEEDLPVAGPPHKYSTAQLVVGYGILAGCVLVVIAAVAAVVIVVRRRRRAAMVGPPA